MAHYPNDWDLEDKHYGNNSEKNTEPNHVDLAHPVLVKVLGVISHSFFIDA